MFLNEWVLLPSELAVECKEHPCPDTLKHQTKMVTAGCPNVLKEFWPTIADVVDAAATLYDSIVSVTKAVE